MTTEHKSPRGRPKTMSAEKVLEVAIEALLAERPS